MEHTWFTVSQAKPSLKDLRLMPCCFFLELGFVRKFVTTHFTFKAISWARNHAESDNLITWSDMHHLCGYSTPHQSVVLHPSKLILSTLRISSMPTVIAPYNQILSMSTCMPTSRFCFLMCHGNIHNCFPEWLCSIPTLAVFPISK